MTKKSDGWSPYALEPLRIAYLRRRRLIASLLLLLLLSLLWLSLETTTTRETILQVDGKDRGQGGIQIAAPEGDKNKKDHVTVAIEPGRVTRADTGGEATSSQITRAEAPVFERGDPINWNGYLLVYGPFVLLGLFAWFLGKRRGRHDELNYGVYKGALPFEMITASHTKLVFNRNLTRRSVFGKRRVDHLPREMADITTEDGQ